MEHSKNNQLLAETVSVLFLAKKSCKNMYFLNDTKLEKFTKFHEKFSDFFSHQFSDVFQSVCRSNNFCRFKISREAKQAGSNLFIFLNRKCIVEKLMDNFLKLFAPVKFFKKINWAPSLRFTRYLESTKTIAATHALKNVAKLMAKKVAEFFMKFRKFF